MWDWVSFGVAVALQVKQFHIPLYGFERPFQVEQVQFFQISPFRSDVQQRLSDIKKFAFHFIAVFFGKACKSLRFGQGLAYLFG